MSTNRPPSNRRPSSIVLTLLGGGICATITLLFSVSPSNESRAPAIAELAELQDAPVAFPPASDLVGSPSGDSLVADAARAVDGVSTAANSIAADPLATPPETAIPPVAAAPRSAAATEAASEVRVVKLPRVIEGVLERGDTLASSLGAQGVGAIVVDRLAREMRGHYDFRHSQPGHSYRLELNAEGEVDSFRYEISPIVGYELRLSADGNYAVVREEAELWPRQTMVAGIVTSSLYGAITDLGAGPQVANDFTDVFAYDVDFSRMIRAGDEFRVLYEQLYRTGENGEEIFVRPGQILAARYAGAFGQHTAVYFEPEEGRGGYYRPDGSSVQRQFLMAPVRYARITSRYSAARRHPILNITRPHHGIDYAAPRGTPVHAVAGGEVIYNGWAGGFGNLVKIRHESGFVSYYGHLSRFADGLRAGAPVAQKQVIGYVGSTGLSTGPHVCFRVAKNGEYVNPVRMPRPERPPLSDEFKERFQSYSDQLLAALDSGTLVAVDEAL